MPKQTIHPSQKKIPAARVNGAVISQYQVEVGLQAVLEPYRDTKGKVRLSQQEQYGARKHVIDNLIMRELLFQEGRQRDITATQEELQQAMDKIDKKVLRAEIAKLGHEMAPLAGEIEAMGAEVAQKLGDWLRLYLQKYQLISDLGDPRMRPGRTPRETAFGFTAGLFGDLCGSYIPRRVYSVPLVEISRQHTGIQEPAPKKADEAMPACTAASP